MFLQIRFKEPNRGFNNMYISPDEHIVIRNGWLRRQPSDKDAIVNSIPIKNITSISFANVPGWNICYFCGKKSKVVTCATCVNSLLTKKALEAKNEENAKP